MSHTPAPWTVSELDASGEVSEYHIFIEPGVAVIERKVAGQDQHDMADARLIAAAPAMLEALEKCEKYLSDLHDAVGFAFSGGRTEKQLAAVRAAIKAAKGEA